MHLSDGAFCAIADDRREQVMSKSARRTFWYVFLSLVVLTALGSLGFWVIRSRLSQYELVEPTKLASIALPTEPSLLAWSPDGRYVAAGTGYTSGSQFSGPAKVFIADVAKQAVVGTLDTVARVDGLAFSPDGKWLAVASGIDEAAGKGTDAELMVFAVPEFTAQLKAKGTNATRIFKDLAWAPDSQSLCTIDGLLTAEEIRRWTVPGFVEQPAISVKDVGQQAAIAVAPDGITLAIVDNGWGGQIRLLNVEKGTEIWSRKEDIYGFHRAAFTADGKAVGVFIGKEAMPLIGDLLDPDGKQKKKPEIVSWWDVGTGQPASPDKPRFAVQPAAQAESRTYSIAPDSRIWAHALVFRMPDEDSPNVVLTHVNGGKTWGWQVGMPRYLPGKEGVGTNKYLPRPALAFSADGTQLAGTLETPSGWTIAIWAVP